MNSVLNQLDSDTESDEEKLKINHEEGLAVRFKYLEFLQKQTCISKQKITVQRRGKKYIYICIYYS